MHCAVSFKFSELASLLMRGTASDFVLVFFSGDSDMDVVGKQKSCMLVLYTLLAEALLTCCKIKGAQS